MVNILTAVKCDYAEYNIIKDFLMIKTELLWD